MKFTRRHARALAAGAATTAAYLAGAKLTGSRYVRGSALLLLGAIATVGVQTASTQERTLKRRVDQLYSDVQPAVHFINHGGTISGAVTVSSLSTGGGTISTSGGSISCGGLTASSQITASGGISMGNSLIMNLNQAFTFSHITANQIGPGGDRALLGSGATLAQVQARCDFLLQQLEGAGICY